MFDKTKIKRANRGYFFVDYSRENEPLRARWALYKQLNQSKKLIIMVDTAFNNKLAKRTNLPSVQSWDNLTEDDIHQRLDGYQHRLTTRQVKKRRTIFGLSYGAEEKIERRRVCIYLAENDLTETLYEALLSHEHWFVGIDPCEPKEVMNCLMMNEWEVVKESDLLADNLVDSIFLGRFYTTYDFAGILQQGQLQK